MADPKAVLHLVLSLHETQHYRSPGRTWLERRAIQGGLIPPYPEEPEIGAVWMVLPGRSSTNYEADGTDITGPLPGPQARHVLASLRDVLQQLEFAVVVETDWP